MSAARIFICPSYGSVESPLLRSLLSLMGIPISDSFSIFYHRHSNAAMIHVHVEFHTEQPLPLGCWGRVVANTVCLRMASLVALVEGELGSPSAHVAFPPLFQTKEFFIKQCKVPELRINPSVVEEEVQELQDQVLENLETGPVIEEVEAHHASIPLNSEETSSNQEEHHLEPEPLDESDSES
eukprot:Gb_28120 [translate_table: standard]